MTGETDESKRVLIVDDQKLVRFVMRRALGKLSIPCELSDVDDGQAALDALEDEDFDLIITDLKMPEVGGVELTEQLRARRNDVVVVWMTGHGCQSLSEEAERLGVFRCLEKPLEIDVIRDVATQALQDSH